MSERYQNLSAEVLKLHTARICGRPRIRTALTVSPLVFAAGIALFGGRKLDGNVHADPLVFSTVAEEQAQIPNFQVGFDMEDLMCLTPDGSQMPTSNFTMYDNDHYWRNNCRTQYLKQIEQLREWGIKVARMWVMVPELTFDKNTNTLSPTLNENTKNVDEILDAYHNAGIKVKMVLDTAYSCQDKEEFSFDKNIFTDQNKREQYLAAQAVVLEHFKDHPAIDAFDLFNEANREWYFRAVPNYVCGAQEYSEEDIYNFYEQMYTQARTITDKKLVFTIDQLDWVTAPFFMPYVERLYKKGLIDQLDIHMYNPSPEEGFELLSQIKESYPFMKNIPIYHGEAGWSFENGRYYTGCEPNFYTEMTPECQSQLADYTKRSIEQARLHGSEEIHLHAWPGFNYRYARPVQDENGNVVVWKPYPAGWCVIYSNSQPTDQACGK